MNDPHKRAFVINASDNVATALSDLGSGEVFLIGDCVDQTACTREGVRSGHKFALTDIGEGDPIIKYGMVIGHASDAIKSGQWVHLHNVQSQFDERSGTLDGETGAPTEGDVYV